VRFAAFQKQFNDLLVAAKSAVLPSTLALVNHVLSSSEDAENNIHYNFIDFPSAYNVLPNVSNLTKANLLTAIARADGQVLAAEQRLDTWFNGLDNYEALAKAFADGDVTVKIAEFTSVLANSITEKMRQIEIFIRPEVIAMAVAQLEAEAMRASVMACTDLTDDEKAALINDFIKLSQAAFWCDLCEHGAECQCIAECAYVCECFDDCLKDADCVCAFCPECEGEDCENCEACDECEECAACAYDCECECDYECKCSICPCDGRHTPNSLMFAGNWAQLVNILNAVNDEYNDILIEAGVVEPLPCCEDGSCATCNLPPAHVCPNPPYCDLCRPDPPPQCANPCDPFCDVCRPAPCKCWVCRLPSWLNWLGFLCGTNVLNKIFYYVLFGWVADLLTR
jgi:hypothetical protein